eukprot:scaffold1058_cov362-Prasinococcus_capsulatus_cf.AAC.10
MGDVARAMQDDAFWYELEKTGKIRVDSPNGQGARTWPSWLTVDIAFHIYGELRTYSQRSILQCHGHFSYYPMCWYGSVVLMRANDVLLPNGTWTKERPGIWDLFKHRVQESIVNFVKQKTSGLCRRTDALTGAVVLTPQANDRLASSGVSGYILMSTMCKRLDIYGFSPPGVAPNRGGKYHYYDEYESASSDNGNWSPQARLLELAVICKPNNVR